MYIPKVPYAQDCSCLWHKVYVSRVSQQSALGAIVEVAWDISLDSVTSRPGSRLDMEEILQRSICNEPYYSKFNQYTAAASISDRTPGLGVSACTLISCTFCMDYLLKQPFHDIVNCDRIDSKVLTGVRAWDRCPERARGGHAEDIFFDIVADPARPYSDKIIVHVQSTIIPTSDPELDEIRQKERFVEALMRFATSGIATAAAVTLADASAGAAAVSKEHQGETFAVVYNTDPCSEIKFGVINSHRHLCNGQEVGSMVLLCRSAADVANYTFLKAKTVGACQAGEGSGEGSGGNWRELAGTGRKYGLYF